MRREHTKKESGLDKILIKEAVPADAVKCLNYLKQIGRETDNLTFGAEGLPVSPADEAKFLQAVHDDRGSVSYFAWHEGHIVGDVSLNALPRRMSHRSNLGLLVVKAWWGKGIGSSLLQKAVDYAEANGVELINLEVRSDNYRAIRLYERFGFRKIGVSPAYFKIGADYIDFDLMYLDLRYLNKGDSC